MRKSRGFVALVLSFVLIAGPLNAAEPKAGAKCTKAGAISTVGGKKFTCVKSGTKLVWNKGVAAKAAAKPAINPVLKPAEPTPVATPVPKSSPAPVATPTPTPTAIAPIIPKAPTSFDDLIENYAGIAYAAWSKSKAKIEASKKTATNIRFVMSPTSQLTNKNPEAAFDLVSRLYSGYSNPVNTDILVFNFEDRDWAIKEANRLMPIGIGDWISGIACATKSTCWGAGVFSDGSSTLLIVLTVGNLSANNTNGTLEAHEYTHAIQQTQMKATQPWPTRDPWPPVWYLEGQANFTQNAAMWFESFDSYMSFRRGSTGELFRNSMYDSAYMEKYFVVNPPEEWRFKYEIYRMYDLGSMFVEILTALKGPDSTMEMWRLAGTGMGFAAAFNQVYGITFEKALPIMVKAIALELGRN
jgi:hypothetical protein